MAVDLSTNPELKRATFDKMQQPRVKFYWKEDTDPNQIDFSSDIISASGTIEVEGDFGEPTKNSFSVELTNENNTTGNVPKLHPGFFFPDNSGSISEKVRIETGYNHSGAGAKTLTQTKGIVTTLNASTETKSANLYATDEGKNFDMEITHGSLISNSYPNKIIQAVINDINSTYGYSMSLIIKSIDVNPDVDESAFFVKHFSYYKQKGWDLIGQICEASLGKFFINRNGQAEYWTYNYLADKINNAGTNYQFSASTKIFDTDTEVIPVLENSLSISKNNIINKVNCDYFDFITDANKLSDTVVTFEVDVGQTFNAETFFDDRYVGSFGATSNWKVYGYLNDDYDLSDSAAEIIGADITISSVNNFATGFTFNATNTGIQKLYVRVIPYVVAQYRFYSKTATIRENGTSNIPYQSWVDGDYNYALNKENAKDINNVLVQSKNWAENCCYLLIQLYRKPWRELNIKTTGMPQIDMGDIIQVKNYIEVKAQVIYGMIKKIDWMISLSDGYVQNMLINVFLSTALVLPQYIYEYFNDLSQTNTTDTTAIVNTTSGTLYSGFDYNSATEGTTIANIITESFDSSNTSRAGAGNTTRYFYDFDKSIISGTTNSSSEASIYSNVIIDGINSTNLSKIDTGTTDAVFSGGVDYICKGGAGAYTNSKVVTINFNTPGMTSFALFPIVTVPANTSITYEYSTNNGGAWTAFTDSVTVTVSGSTLKVRVSLSTTDVSATPIFSQYYILINT